MDLDDKQEIFRQCSDAIAQDILDGAEIDNEVINKHCIKYSIEGSLRTEFMSWFRLQMRVEMNRRQSGLL